MAHEIEGPEHHCCHCHEGSKKSPNFSRRTFLLSLGWGSFFSSIAVAALASVRGLVPDVLFEPSKIFKAERPEDYPEGTVKLVLEENVFIDRDADGIYVVSATCTHLGCRVEWVEEQNGYQCPCHGAKFRRDGTNYAGPAPKPLPHYLVSIAKDGRLVVDKSKEVAVESRLKV